MTEPTPPIEKTVAKQTTAPTDNTALERVNLPRIAIQFCTQCRWMLRAAYVRLIRNFPASICPIPLVLVSRVQFEPSSHESQPWEYITDI